MLSNLQKLTSLATPPIPQIIPLASSIAAFVAALHDEFQKFFMLAPGSASADQLMISRVEVATALTVFQNAECTFSKRLITTRSGERREPDQENKSALP
jgi:hypothetical protein